MSTHKSKPIEEFAQQIQEAFEQIQQIEETLEEKPDRDEVEHWSSELAFKLEQIHDDVLNLQTEVAEVSAQVDFLQN
jgi:phosphoglycerate-specific signal transduction histidine kinase